MAQVYLYKKTLWGIKKFLTPLIGIMALSLYIVNILISFTVCFLMSPLRFIPSKCFQISYKQVMDRFAFCWVSINTWIQDITIPHTQWVVQSASLEQLLHADHWYLMISNHQSWVDILVLQRVFNRHIPFPKFFFKRELLWTLPFASWICWLLNFPLVYRYSRKQIIQNPVLKKRNLEITRQACELYKQIPTTIVNFAEGTRFSSLRHKLQVSPYQHLMKPQAGGIALSLAILHQHLDKILNITICYHTKKLSFWNFLCGEIHNITVYIETVSITPDLIGDYQHDQTSRVYIQQWLNDMWQKKDELIKQHVLLMHDISC